MNQDTSDRNLLFGVLALQAGLLEAGEFAEACSAWAGVKNTSLADLLVHRGILSAEDKGHVEYLLQRKVMKHSGDVQASLAAVTPGEIHEVLADVADPDIQDTLSHLPPTTGQAALATIAYQPRGRDRYTLARLHAKGGIGQVWLAHDRDLGRQVALKELRTERAGNPALAARFVEEAKITGQLEHPSIVPVYELVHPAGEQSPFYTMRFIKGHTLKDAAQRYHERRRAGSAGPLELRNLLGAFVAVCNALAYAHSRGVIHRDLKGSNVVLGDYGEVIVLDWGLAKVMGQKDTDSSLLPVSLEQEDWRDQTVQGQTVGTPAYMSPEQAEGRLQQLDQRSDVYGLGAVLYEILTGQAPFQGDNTQESLKRVVQELPVPPGQRAPGTPRALEAICLKALAKAPAARYASAQELAREVQHWLADEPVAAYQEPWRARARRWLGKHRTLATATAATLLVATLSLGTATALLQASNDRERQARAGERQARLEAEHNLQDAKTNLRRAQENFTLARDAVDKSFTEISESPQLKARGLEKLRKELLGQAKSYYERFVQAEADRPDLQAERGRAYLRLAEITAATGDRSQATRICQQARTIFEQLSAQEPELATYRDGLADVLSVLAENYRMARQIAEARPAFETAQSVRAQLAAEHPESLPYRYRWAVCLRDLGEFYHLEFGQMPQSESTLEKALSLCEDLVRAQPGNLDYQSALARTLSTLATLQSWIKPQAQARATYDRAIAQYAKLVRDHPDVPDYLQRQAENFHNLGIMYNNARQPAEAKQALEEALPIRERLAREHPDVLQYAQELADARVSIAVTLAQLGDHARAAALTDEALAKTPLGYPLAHYNGACAYANCFSAVLRNAKLASAERQKLAEQYGAHAVKLLRQAQEMGYFKAPNRVLEMKIDPDLVPLRSRDDYSKLVKELEDLGRNK